ncbi:MAG: GNAT family N-acetyltransferase [Candidatus Aenigmarchaeota archaeon]|nr:GNAT family N-acetyltransferase [Candidatus Aenigmarchaeota archaeon]
MKIVEPKTKEDFGKYYELRWRVLRMPLGMPRGSERDELENSSAHVMAVDNGLVVGVGRVHLNSKNEAQIRYMAVDSEKRGKGTGKRILNELERVAARLGAENIILNARVDAIDFYKRYGYQTVGERFLYIGIEHQKMEKVVK